MFIDGARTATGMDALEWVRRGADLGAGEIVVNSIDADGTAAGYELAVTRAVADAVNVPVIASGGAGTVDHIAAGLTDGGASAAIISSILYSPRLERNVGVRELKSGLAERGVHLRPWVGRGRPGVPDVAALRLPCDAGRVRPQALEVVERTRLAEEHVDHELAVVEQDPRCVAQTLDAARRESASTLSASSTSSQIVRT